MKIILQSRVLKRLFCLLFLGVGLKFSAWASGETGPAAQTAAMLEQILKKKQCQEQNIGCPTSKTQSFVMTIKDLAKDSGVNDPAYIKALLTARKEEPEIFPYLPTEIETVPSALLEEQQYDIRGDYKGKAKIGTLEVKDYTPPFFD